MKTTLLILTLLTVLLGCEKKNTAETPDCGCESETQTTIPESANWVGRISYKTQSDDPMDTYYNNHFWVTVEQGGMYGHLIVCNRDILKSDFDELISDTKKEIEVMFSGHEKEVCEKRFNPATISHSRITLTSIERL